ncbi:hypothetical protein [Bacteriovorax sp. Seq25_V]|uniref:hypothetical protein n=1 Tax=Bacteriovorax sp. Seq25_V TaxID=1201288 RepID=UPI00038A31B9|nr:hypothetical protein [Bacteriovorax sp. Seq25_V]EQC44894.1 putative lipoprotein [Bacteriovorax sp. Seq25_V]
MKLLISLVSLLSMFSASAACIQGNITIGVNLSQETLAAAYENGETTFNGDTDHLYTILNGEKTVYDIGTVEDDNAGNFLVKGISSEFATYFEVYHDHETWHYGLEGYFTTTDNKIIDLRDFKNCDYNSLFE